MTSPPEPKSEPRTEHDEFREYCRAWLRDNRPPPAPVRLPQHPIETMTRAQLDYLQAWQRRCYDAGLVGADYPVEYGGRGHKGFQRIANEEMNRARTPFLVNMVGLGMAAPTIYHHAQEELKRELLPPLLSGEQIWCQGFSEPGSGSDLASVQASLTPDPSAPGDYLLNGHKVWTSLAHFAQWMILLVRTSREHKHKGLSYYVVPVEGHRGVTVRPLIKMTGEAGFNEVIFEDTPVKDAWRLGATGEGWSVAMTTLLHERGAGPLVTPAGGVGSEGLAHNVRGLVTLAREQRRNGRPAAEDPQLRARIAALAIRERGMLENAKRARSGALVEHPMRLPLQVKLASTELAQDLAAAALEVEGPAASLYLSDERAPVGGQWALAYMNSFGATIAAGTSEIQRNILGERVLGLPKS
ncbi:MAG: acyl-CoA dehydrogenase family protein [Sandaracinaceae bacterium]|nr:acyl-CoA dehydrogenase family protein [Sandaracinaceae bacterium]